MDVKPGKKSGMIKTHKESNPAIIITSDSGTQTQEVWKIDKKNTRRTAYVKNNC